jgi:hypothetical protein
VSCVSIALALKLTIIGRMRRACPNEIPWIVYNKLKEPRGPLFDRNRYRINPSATVGIPIRVEKMVFTSFRPGNFLSPINVPSGIPRIEAIRRA